MGESSADVVIVGGGIAGMTTAYYLAKSGVPSVVVERDAIGSHASGFAYGGLSPLSGFGIPGPLAEIAQDGMRVHRELSKSLLEETGIDVDWLDDVIRQRGDHPLRLVGLHSLDAGAVVAHHVEAPATRRRMSPHDGMANRRVAVDFRLSRRKGPLPSPETRRVSG